MIDLSPEEQFEEIRQDLHNLARFLMAKERPDHTLSPTALLGEVWIKVFSGEGRIEATDRAKLIGKAANAMRWILTDHARKRLADKRGGSLSKVPLDAVMDRCVARNINSLDVGLALSRMEKDHERPATVMTLSLIGGFSVGEIAAQLGLSEQTIRNDMKLARAWFLRYLEGDNS